MTTITPQNVLSKEITTEVVAHDPTFGPTRERTVRKVRACEVRKGDIDLASKDNPQHNRVVDEVRTDGDVTTMWFVGSPHYRCIMADQRITIAR